MEKTVKIDESRVTAALAYVSILFIIPMLKKDNEFCQFHAKQGIVLFVLSVVVSLLGWMPVIWRLSWLIELVIVIVSIMAIVKTLNGEKWEIPYIGKYAKLIKL